MKLKTLKDFKGYIGDGPSQDDPDRISKEELKQEAIKWVKEYDDNNSDWFTGKVDFIKTFFNITEEDLK